MRDIVPRNSELIGVMPDDTYKIEYQRYKGLAIDMRSDIEIKSQPEASYGVKHPEVPLLGSLAVSLFATSGVADTLVDMPDIVQTGTGLAIITAASLQYIKNSRAQTKYKKQKNEIRKQTIFEIADNDPNVYVLPFGAVRFRLEQGEDVNAIAQELFRTPHGRDLLKSMNIEVDDSAGLENIKNTLRIQLDRLWIDQALNDPAEGTDANALERNKERNAKIQELKSKIISFDYDYKYGTEFGGDVQMNIIFSPAETVHTIIDRAFNKSQLILDTSSELQELSLLMQRYKTLSGTIDDIPHRDHALHSNKIAQINNQKKDIGLQIVGIITAIKQKALEQQDTILSGYADGIL